MSFIARLNLGDNAYNVLEADFGVSQAMGAHNRPNRDVEIELIHLVVEGSSRSELWEWAMASSNTKNGNIVFYRRDAVSPMKTLEFESAFCVKYKESFNAEGDMPMKIHLTLSPYAITMQSCQRLQPWPGFESSGSSSASETQHSPQHDEERDTSEDATTSSDSSTTSSSHDEERDTSEDSGTTSSGSSSHDEERDTSEDSGTTSSDSSSHDEERDTSEDSGTTSSDSSSHAEERDTSENSETSSPASSTDTSTSTSTSNNEDKDDIPSFIP